MKLTVKEIEVELQVLTTMEGKGKVGFKVWLVEGEGGGGMSREQGHTIRLKLDPKGAGGGDLNVSGRRD